jgi:transposase
VLDSSPWSAGEKTICGTCGTAHRGWYDRRQRRVRDLSCADHRIYLDLEVRRVDCRQFPRHEAPRGKQRQFIKGQKYTLLSHPQNLTGTAKKNLKLLLAANNQLSPTRFHDDPTFKKPICNAVPSRIAKP